MIVFFIKKLNWIIKFNKVYFLLFIFLIGKFGLKAATETFSTGSFIVNMGVTPQTINNGLRPYGLIYDLLKNYNVPIKWVINQTKAKDGIDFTHNGIQYKGGTFIIAAEYRTSTVNTRINYWVAQGVVGSTTISPLVLDVTKTLTTAPFWTMDKDNGNIAVNFLNNALIPASAYSINKLPNDLNGCDDLFILPHADPTWTLHGNLLNWNLNSKGGIWGGCHAVSVLESVVNPSNSNQKLNFLSTNGLVNYSNHADGKLPYTHINPTDPVFQYMGTSDACQDGGSERVFMPIKTTSAWRPTTIIGTHNPTQTNIPILTDGPVIVNAYGRAFGDANRGLVMYQGGHDINSGGTIAERVAAQRMFFNWSFIACMEKAPIVNYNNIQTQVYNNITYSNFTCVASSVVSGATFTYLWTATIPGTFSNPTSSVTSFTPLFSGQTTAFIFCKVTDNCGRVTNMPIEINVNPNRPPTGMWDANNTNYNTVANGNVSLNDFDPDNNINLNGFTVFSLPAKGTLSLNSNGSYIYTPFLNATGNDNFIYTVCDLGMPIYCDTSIVYIKIHNPPIAKNDSISAGFNNTVNINILNNDIAGSSPLNSSTVAFVGTLPNPSSVGVFTVNQNGIVTFTPASGFIGIATIQYKIFDYYNQFSIASIFVTIHSLSSYDSDGDGVYDNLDDYPNDSTRAFNNYYPSIGYSTLMFEDLWPSKGDFDFNDLVVDYKYNRITNAQNQIVEVKYTIITKAIGAGLHNGFAFQLDYLNPNKISGVLGAKTINVPWLNKSANGTESGQTYANIIVVDDVYRLLNFATNGSMINVFLTGVKANIHITPDTTNLTVEFIKNGVLPAGGATLLNDLPITAFNPYIIVGDSGSYNQNRLKEIHLPNRLPSSKMSNIYWGTKDDDSKPTQNRYFKTATNLPWVLEISTSIPHMQEKIDISNGYLHFIDWASSNGTLFTNWYLNLSGFRDTSKLYLR